jgi:hypothetical protein
LIESIRFSLNLFELKQKGHCSPQARPRQAGPAAPPSPRMRLPYHTVDRYPLPLCPHRCRRQAPTAATCPCRTPPPFFLPRGQAPCWAPASFSLSFPLSAPIYGPLSAPPLSFTCYLRSPQKVHRGAPLHPAKLFGHPEHRRSSSTTGFVLMCCHHPFHQ